MCIRRLLGLVLLVCVIGRVEAQSAPTTFQLPIANYSSSIQQGFGAVNPAYNYKKHVADDIASIAGTPVYAAANGTVMYARSWGTCPNWGHVVVVEHVLSDGTRVNSIYGHLDPASIRPREGDSMTAGQQLGVVGHWIDPADGTPCWGDHLHFGIRLGAFGPPNVAYPSWLAGYLDGSSFPGTYCDPRTFVASQRCVSAPAITYRLTVNGVIFQRNVSAGVPLPFNGAVGDSLTVYWDIDGGVQPQVTPGTQVFWQGAVRGFGFSTASGSRDLVAAPVDNIQINAGTNTYQTYVINGSITNAPQPYIYAASMQLLGTLGGSLAAVNSQSPLPLSKWPTQRQFSLSACPGGGGGCSYVVANVQSMTYVQIN